MSIPKNASVKGREVVQVIESPVVSIQVQTTIQKGGDVCICASDDNDATHWSVYTRNAEGRAEWITDYGINRNAALAKQKALLKAAKLSQKYQAFIEPIR